MVKKAEIADSTPTKFDARKHFAKVIKAAKLEDAACAADGIPVNDITGFIDTGSYAFNGLISGSIYKGLPNNKVLGLGGEQATGKTYFAISILGFWLTANPTGLVYYFETEGAVTSEMLIERLGEEQASRILVIPINTVQEFKNQGSLILDEYKNTPKENRYPYFFVLDSLGMLSTTKEMSDAINENPVQDMTRAKEVKAAFRLLTRAASRFGVPMIVTNHVYAQIGSTSHTKSHGGGSGLLYAASIIADLSKRKDKDTADEHVGNIIHVKQSKGRLTKEGSMIDCKLSFTKGLSRHYYLIDILLATGKITKVGNKYQWPGIPDKTFFETTIYKDPERFFTKEVLDMCDAACGELFNYGTDLPDDSKSNAEALEELTSGVENDATV